MFQERTEQPFRIKMKSVRQAQMLFEVITNDVFVLAEKALINRRLGGVSEPGVEFFAVDHELLTWLAEELLFLRLERPALQT